MYPFLLTSFNDAASREAFMKSLDAPMPVSIRLNRQKTAGAEITFQTEIPWCADGRYLSARPSFTLDPLLHAGAYYVQEAASMFLEQAVRSAIESSAGMPLTVLDLCAAPGGKSTHLLSLLPAGSLLVANEAIRRRSAILVENLAKWGYPNYIATNNDPAAFGRMPCLFDLIVADLPCSGEGMFRKEPALRETWSVNNVHLCAARQRRIVHDVWEALKPGGLFVYSTCTFNTEENEENVRALADSLDATIEPIPVRPEWNISGAACYDIPVCRFYPHRTQSEGFFIALLRKKDGISRTLTTKGMKRKDDVCCIPALREWIKESEGYEFYMRGASVYAIRKEHEAMYRLLSERANVASAGIYMGELQIGKGKKIDILPSTALAMSIALRREIFPYVELSYDDAIRYLRKEAIILPPDTEKGYVLVTFCDTPLGFVKNIGARANNLYPMEWRIRMSR